MKGAVLTLPFSASSKGLVLINSGGIHVVRTLIVMAFIKISRCGNLSSDYFLNVRGVLLRSFVCSKFYTKVVYKMRSAYFQNVQGEGKVQISISFNEFNTNQLLRFERNISETLDDFLKRLECKVKDLYMKKVMKKVLKKQNIEVPCTEPRIDLFFLVNNQRLTNVVNFEDIFSNKFSGDLKLRIAESDYDVIINSPLVKNLTLPRNLRVGSIAYPEKFETFSTAEDKSEFIWFRSLDPKSSRSWEKCGEGFFYNLKEADSEHYLKLVCTPKNFAKTGPTYEVSSKEVVKRFENTEEIQKRHEFTKERTGDDGFRIVSYNILADCYTQTKEAKANIFTYCDPEFLDFEYRKCLLNFELSGYNADILCLQEVDRNFYKNELLLWFTGLNYSCSFHEKEGAREGCAFMYDPKKFDLLSINRYVFTNELLNNPVLCGISEKVIQNANLRLRLQNISSLIQVAVLECLTDANHIVVIGNTHFYFHPNASHIRLLQGIVSCKILMTTTEEIHKNQPDKKISVILCGDFNSTPETGFHQLLTEGSVEENHPDWKSSADEEIENVSFKHMLRMESAYGDCQYTNYTPLFKGCLDYIYFQSDLLELSKTVPIPAEEVLSQDNGIPSKCFPSDHVALIADLKFKT